MRLALIDRDGVISEERKDYVKTPQELVLIPGAAEACAKFNGHGIKIALVTNQSAVGRSIISAAMLEKIQEKLQAELSRYGAKLDLMLACYDAPWAATHMRKPGDGMLRQAMQHFGVLPTQAVMIGDQLSDLRAGKSADVRRILVRTGKGAETLARGLPEDILPVSVYDDLGEAVDALLTEKRV